MSKVGYITLQLITGHGKIKEYVQMTEKGDSGEHDDEEHMLLSCRLIER